MENYAYITYLDNDYYFYSVLALYLGWKKTNSKYPFYCACTGNVPPHTIKSLNEAGINTIWISAVLGLGLIKANLRARGSGNWASALGKLAIYRLEQFDKFIFLDADTYVYKNLDHLFKYPHYTGVADGLGRKTNGNDKFVSGDNYFKQLNAGVMVVEPSEELYNKIMKTTSELKMDRPWADQTIIAELYPNWPNEPEKHLPIYYNCFGGCMYEYFKNIPDFSTDKIYILHLVGDWKLSPTYNFDREINKKGAEVHIPFLELLTEICKEVNAFIKEKQKEGKLLDRNLVRLPAYGKLRAKVRKQQEREAKK